MFVKNDQKTNVPSVFCWMFEKSPKAGAYIPSSMNHGKVVYKKQKRSRGPGVYQNLTWVFPKTRGTPKWMVKIMENPIKMDDLGVPLFSETPTCSKRKTKYERNCEG